MAWASLSVLYVARPHAFSVSLTLDEEFPMQPIFQPLIGLVLALSLATGACDLDLTVYSAAEPSRWLM